MTILRDGEARLATGPDPLQPATPRRSRLEAELSTWTEDVDLAWLSGASHGALTRRTNPETNCVEFLVGTEVVYQVEQTLFRENQAGLGVCLQILWESLSTHYNPVVPLAVDWAIQRFHYGVDRPAPASGFAPFARGGGRPGEIHFTAPVSTLTATEIRQRVEAARHRIVEPMWAGEPWREWIRALVRRVSAQAD
jgi:hypothetical protein